jgi:E3 ubiquitin-protein ligase RNF14
MDDERETEIETILTIFPEEATRDGNAITISLEFAPEDALVVRWIGDSSGAPETNKFSRLPPIILKLELPDGYPDNSPPKASVSTNPDFLPLEIRKKVEQHVEAMWEEMGRYQVVYTFIDYIQEQARTSFETQEMEVDSKLRIDLLAQCAEEERAHFERQYYECGVCLTTKSGKDCYQLRTCGHVFCRDCLQSCYEVHITEGGVWNVQCLATDCTVLTMNGKKIRPNIAPAELLQIPLSRELVQRYADLRRKKKMEADKNLIYCPRSFCQAPARSKKYPVISDISLLTEVDEEEKGGVDVDDEEERLRVCEKCNFAFCKVCKASWHGDYYHCTIRDKGELSKEEEAAEDWIRNNTAVCPTCSVRITKTMGCNHMTCSQCQGHLCYLCGSWLDPSNPYGHYQKQGTTCYHRLFDPEDVLSNNDNILEHDEEDE